MIGDLKDATSISTAEQSVLDKLTYKRKRVTFDQIDDITNVAKQLLQKKNYASYKLLLLRSPEKFMLAYMNNSDGTMQHLATVCQFDNVLAKHMASFVTNDKRTQWIGRYAADKRFECAVNLLR